MERPFDDIYAGIKSQLEGAPCEVADTGEIRELRSAATDYDGHIALGNALSRQLRYREAADAYGAAVEMRPDDTAAHRLRAGRYLSTLQCAAAKADFLFCYEHGGNSVDVTYRLGLCCYFERKLLRGGGQVVRIVLFALR